MSISFESAHHGHILVFVVMSTFKPKIMKLRGVGANDAKELVDDIQSMWGAEYFLDPAQKLVKSVINELAKYNTAEVDRSRPVKKEAATQRRSDIPGKRDTNTGLDIDVGSTKICTGPTS